MVNLGTTILSALLGGLIFALARSWVWRRYTKPELKLSESASTSYETGDDGDLTQLVYRAPVENTGRSAATNCKPELRMEGELEGDIYEVNQQLTWAEGDNPQRITINSDERAEVDLMRITSEEADGHIAVEPTLYIELPGNDRWGGDDSITVLKREEERVVDVSVPKRIEKSEFSQISWETAEVVITAEEAAKVVGDLSFELESERGMVGMGVKIET